MHLIDWLRHYAGYLIGAALLGAVILLNHLSFRRQWSSYPTLTEYRRAHPASVTADGARCHRCGSTPFRIRVGARGEVFRCSFCELPIYRVPR
jgi:hypothetical protein